MHHQIAILFFAGIVLFVGAARFVFLNRYRASRPRKDEARDRYECMLSARREYENQRRRYHLA